MVATADAAGMWCWLQIGNCRRFVTSVTREYVAPGRAALEVLAVGEDSTARTSDCMCR